MIQINNELCSYCEKCENINLKTNISPFIYGGGKILGRIITIKCANKNMCESIKQFLKEQEEERCITEHEEK